MIKSEVILEDEVITADIDSLKVEGNGKLITFKNMSRCWEDILIGLLGTGHLKDFILEHKEELKEELVDVLHRDL